MRVTEFEVWRNFKLLRGCNQGDDATEEEVAEQNSTAHIRGL